MSTAASDATFVIDRPRIEVDGQEQESLAVDLVSLEVCSDEEGITRLRLVVLNWGRTDRGEEPGFQYFDGDAFELGSEIRVRLGAADVEEEVFVGFITAVEGVYRELDPPQLEISAEDALQWARVRQRTRVFEQSTDASIAERAAQELSLGTDASASGPTHTQLLQVNRSDLGLLRERARAVDARVGIVDGKLAFVPRRGDEVEPVPLSRVSDLLRCRVCADLAHQRTEVQVHGWSVRDKDGIHETAGSSDVSAEAEGGRLGGDVLADIGVDAVEHHHLEMPVTSDEATNLAQSLIRRRARRFLVARCTTDGTPALRVGGKVHLVDIGAWFEGIYHLAEVRHCWDQREGLRTHFVAEKADLGASA